MGSPLSPAMCLMIVSVYTEIAHQTCSTYLTNMHHHALLPRYVNDRLLLIPDGLHLTPPFETLTHPDLYKAPIILETEPDQEFLDSQLELVQCPRDLSQVLSPYSASGPVARLCFEMFQHTDRRISSRTSTSSFFSAPFVLQRLRIPRSGSDQDFEKSSKALKWVSACRRSFDSS